MLSLFKRKKNKLCNIRNRESSKISYNINIVINNNCCRTKFQEGFLQSKFGQLYTIIKPIYERENKSAYIVESNTTHKKFILKIKENTQVTYFEEDISKILINKHHKNIMKLVSFLQEYNYYYFMYEFIDGYNLLEYIKKVGELSEKEIKNILNQIIDGLSFLHKNHILHCDLKLENIIINDKKEIKIIDFDLSIVCDNDEGYISNSIFGTLQYIAPESYDLCIYSKKSDIWQIGVILYILITNKFPHNNEITLVNSFSNLCRKNVFKHIDLEIPKEIITKKNFDQSLYTLLENMLNFDEKERYNVEQIKNSDWLKN